MSMEDINSGKNDFGLLQRDDTALVVIDVQERLFPHIAHGEMVADNIVRLLRFAKIIDLPVVMTEQQNLGPTIPQIKEAIPELPVITKIDFSAFRCDEFIEHLEKLRKRTLLLTGIESHICINQTALQALQSPFHFRVHVIGDAVSSRSLDNKDFALDRMRQSGAVISSTEMVIYELLERAGTDEFREALKLIK